MAAIDVHLFLEKLKQLMISGLDFVASQRDELKSVYEYINAMDMLLKSAEEGSTDMVMHIEDTVFEAENIVDVFFVHSFSSGRGGDCDLSTKLDSVKAEMEAIINIYKLGKFELEWWYTKAADRTNHVLGLRPHSDKSMCRLKHGKSLEIISIVGLPGKTTLLKQIYNDHGTKEKFEIQVWIKVCQGYRMRDFLAAILESLNPIYKDKWVTGEEALGSQLLECLHDHKYLIVMNDMSTAHELFDLQKYLPDQCNGSKVIVTTWEAMGSNEIEEPDCYDLDVRMFLEKLKQLMISGLDLVASQRDELKSVYEYINSMGMLLKSTEEEGSKDMFLHIRDMVFEAENIVDVFFFHSFSSGRGGDCDLSTKLDSVKVEMEAIINFYKHGKFELERWYTKAADSTNHVVGLRPHRDKSMCRLKYGKSLEIISIVDLSGTEEKFETQVWIKVCQGYRKRDLIAAILESLNPIYKEKWVTGEEALGSQLFECLQDHKYFIVMNDMSTSHELFDLQTYLPDQCNGSKVIVATWEAMVSKEIEKPDYYDPEVRIFLEKLKQLMISSLDFVASQRDELQIVYEYINEMSMLLKSTEEEVSTDKKVINIAMHIRDLVFEAENIVDLFIFDSVSSGGDGGCDLSTKLESVKGDMEAVIRRFKGKFEFEWWYMKAAEGTTGHVVGLRPQIDKIMSRLKHGKSLEVISIVGLPGTGKTTLAKKIYNDHCTFEIRVWTKVCQEYGKRGALAAILESFNHYTLKDERDNDEEALGAQLLDRLQDHKYLIVMDDMWSAQALFDLQTYLPDQCNGSKIIVTTQDSMVSMAIKEQDYYDSHTIRLEPLSEKDSWELLESKLLGHQTTISKELADFGKSLVEQCHGLPLAITVISKVLARKSEIPSLWEGTANTLAIFQESYTENLEWRYNELPPHLKACLLYIGSFPVGYHIPVCELVRLLIAEGFVIEGDVGIAPCPEVVAEGYISDLFDRCLVVVLEKSFCGATKTCCISSLMREFCNAKVEESKFAYHACSSSAIQNDPRRLFMCFKCYPTLSPEASMQSLRSFVCYNGDDKNDTNIGRIFSGKEVRHLKVVASLSIRSFSDYKIGVMVSLTYVEFKAGNFVPESITNLFNLETLIFSKARVAYLPAGLLKLDKLKYICNKAGALCFSKYGNLDISGISGNLQTVYQLCSCPGCRLILTKSPRIRKLNLSSYGYCFPDDLSFLEDLETLKAFKFSYRGDPRATTTFQLKLPNSIKRLTLRWTYLEWEMISVLGTLPNLEVLQLLKDACVRKEGGLESCWDTSAQGLFPKLKCLRLSALDITKWVANDAKFNSLEVLSILGCKQLRMLPSGLAQRAPLLRTLELKRCNGYVKDFFGSIGKE